MEDKALISPLNANALSEETPVVLVVDDDKGSLMMAEAALDSAGYRVVQASDGLIAVEQFKQHKPDLIIMDAIMPNMDGYEAIAEIRSTEAGAHVPILMITGLDDLDSITRAYDEGATDFLTKPINFFVLPHRVQYMLRSNATADELRKSQAKLDDAQRIARLGNWEWNVKSDVMVWSREFARVLGFNENSRQGSWSQFLEKVSENHRFLMNQAVQHSIEEATEFSYEFAITGADSREKIIRIESEPRKNDTGECTCMLGTVQDITEYTNAQKQIHDLAYYDLVTGLPNRAQLYENLAYALKVSDRLHSQFALLFLDLDHFKNVNDTLGHDAGDDLLRQVSDRLASVLRESDVMSAPSKDAGTKHTVARIGGDEFVVLLPNVTKAVDVAKVAERIGVTVSAPYTIHDVDVAITTTIGISLYPSDGRDAETLMKHADVAMYHAKENGRNGFQFYSKSIHDHALARFSMERELRSAIKNNELALMYQPKIALATGAAVGVEALLRWNHPERGAIPPDEFLPVAEETGLIVVLGQWVLKESAYQMQQWIEQGLGAFSVAVNCSPAQFTRGNIISDISHALEYSGLDPKLLEIELTENLFLNNIDKGIEILKSMKQLGVQIAVDDFGTGFSSLSYLKRLPADKLKIDQSFVKDLHVDKGDSAIVAAIVTLSQNLGLKVIAEGVENQQQMDILRGFNCNEVQGYHVCYPLTADEFAEWLSDQNTHFIDKVSGF
jgi:diguanylate cyclase (GGDEF)-like protein